MRPRGFRYPALRCLTTPSNTLPPLTTGPRPTLPATLWTGRALPSRHPLPAGPHPTSRRYLPVCCLVPFCVCLPAWDAAGSVLAIRLRQFTQPGRGYIGILRDYAGCPVPPGRRLPAAPCQALPAPAFTTIDTYSCLLASGRACCRTFPHPMPFPCQPSALWGWHFCRTGSSHPGLPPPSLPDNGSTSIPDILPGPFFCHTTSVLRYIPAHPLSFCHSPVVHAIPFGLVKD